MIRVYPYRAKSRSANRLARILGGTIIKPGGNLVLPNTWDTVINWGSSECPYTSDVKVLNRPEAIALASNKKRAFVALQSAGVSIPNFATTSESVSWKGVTVVRHKLTGHSGEGIEIVEAGETLPPAPLYVEYVKKEDEYRIHVIGESITTIQRKGARKDFDGKPDFRVRNHKNGFVFVRNGDDGEKIKPPQAVLDQAVKAIQALGLDFGAVDIIYNRSQERAYVLEVNTAPGMEGSTIGDYAEGFKKFLEELKG